MSTQTPVTADERTMAIMYRANTWGLNFVVFALMLDIVYRSAVLHAATWDLWVVVVGSGVITLSYAARHHVLALFFNWRSLIVLIVTVLACAIFGFIAAITKAF